MCIHRRHGFATHLDIEYHLRPTPPIDKPQRAMVDHLLPHAGRTIRPPPSPTWLARKPRGRRLVTMPTPRYDHKYRRRQNSRRVRTQRLLRQYCVLFSRSGGVRSDSRFPVIAILYQPRPLIHQLTCAPAATVCGTVCCIRCHIAVSATTRGRSAQSPDSQVGSSKVPADVSLPRAREHHSRHAAGTRDARVMRKPDKRPYTAVQERGNKVDRIGLWEAKTKPYSSFGMAGLIRPPKRCLIRRCCLWLYAFGGAAKQSQLTLYCTT
jgi:hypothetical protein